ncbi:DUF3261 domain-containing protein [Marinomonas transparens]|uniref:DUF3261 domain-containing protein n=1 Tax=Marinomonas transparens TaxID=2795388 RepID=A0A934JRF9_9GAMM|nr:DUF3261 domain-containing protein [Marinomonas transparens]MBJ7538694.1 DUF3261 domain-containing protein [Marinomonas transparens]
MSRLIQVVLISISVALTGCSLFTPIEQTVPNLVLLAPVAGTPTQVLKQGVTFKKHEQEKQFIAITRFTEQQTKLVALLPTGQSFLYLEYDGQNFKEKNEAGIELPSKDILAMIQFTLWPEGKVKESYPSNLGWRVEISPNLRSLYYKAQLRLKVELNGDKTNITNYADDYQVNIDTFEKEELAQ